MRTAVYLDNSVYNRPFDDQSQPRIWLETLSLSLILQMVESGELKLVSSAMVVYENSRSPFPDRREWVYNCLGLAKYTKKLDEQIRAKAQDFEKEGLRAIDALHLACAEAAGVDYFLTCDDKVVNRYKGKKIRVMNPIEFILIMTTQGR